MRTALTLLAVAAYANSFQSGFPLDNKALILEDARVHEATRANVDLILNHSYWWPIGESGLYRPVTTLSYLFNYAILGNGDRPFGYHVVNFSLHVVNVLLVYGLSRRLISTPALLPVAIAAIWAVHPLSTEAVTNIVGRADLLAAFAVLGGLWIYLRAIESAGGRRSFWLVALAGISMVGVFSKESAVVIVGVIVLYVATLQRAPARGGFAIALLMPLLLLWSQRSAVLGAAPAAELPFVDNPIVGAGFWTGRLTAIGVMARHLWLIAWPMTLSADYSYAQIPLASGRVQDWIGIGLILAAMVGCIVVWRRDRTAFFFAGFALLTFLPSSNLLFPTGTIMAERTMYLPSIGVIALIAIGADRIARTNHGQRILAAIALVVVAAFGVRTWIRNADWRDDVALWSSAVRASPHSFKAHRGLAEALYESDPRHANIDRVVAEIDQALSPLDTLPAAQNDAKTYRLAGAYYLEQGDARRGLAGGAYERAAAALRRCLEIIHAQSPSAVSPAADAYRVLSAAYVRLNDGGNAVDAATRARSLEPTNVIGYRQAASAFLAANRKDDAAIVLMTGSMVTDDRTLARDLVELYQQGLDPLGCAVVDTRDGPAINPACATVRRHVCAATAEAIRIHVSGGRADRAQRLRDSAARQFQCR